MNVVSPPNDPSPGSSVFDFPAHRETEHMCHPGASPLRKPHDADPGSFIVLSGGTGCNPICSAFGPEACYVLPISDDGGSSSEIIRVLGGPSIGVCGCPNDTIVSIYLFTQGDIRSRLIRLIPTVEKGSPLDAIRTLLAHRLSSDPSEKDAREEWRDIVEGRSRLWAGIPSDRKEMIRGKQSVNSEACTLSTPSGPGFLVYFESELLKRAHKNFSFMNGR